MGQKYSDSIILAEQHTQRLSIFNKILMIFHLKRCFFPNTCLFWPWMAPFHTRDPIFYTVVVLEPLYKCAKGFSPSLLEMWKFPKKGLNLRPHMTFADLSTFWRSYGLGPLHTGQRPCQDKYSQISAFFWQRVGHLFQKRDFPAFLNSNI